jgi:hypothetical protein
MSNANVQITQDFTTDKALAVKAIRLPRGILSSADSPYLSLISLLKRLPETKVRRQIIMVSDGIDRLRDMNGVANLSPPAWWGQAAICMRAWASLLVI